MGDYFRISIKLNETNMQKVIEICPTTTQGRVRKGALLVDVREENEVAELAFDVPDIVNIPFSKFDERFLELPKNRELVMVCALGIRSYKAVETLLNNGYDRVVNMQYGIVRWVEKGFPTKGDTSIVLGNNVGCGCGEKENESAVCWNTTAVNSKSSCY